MDFDYAAGAHLVLADVSRYNVAVRLTDEAQVSCLAKFNGIIVIEGGKTVRAKDFGWNPENATEALQNAIDSGAAMVIVDAMPSPWCIGKIKLQSYQTIRLEKGTRIHAYLPQWGENKRTPLFDICQGVSNFALEGAGIEDSLVWSFASKEQRLEYCKSGQ